MHSLFSFWSCMTYTNIWKKFHQVNLPHNVPNSLPTVSESGSTMGMLLVRYSTLKWINLDGVKFVRMPPPKLPDADGPEAEASSSMEVGLWRSSTGIFDSLECPMVEVAIRAGPMSVGDASCITEFTANCRNRNHFHEHQTHSNEGYFRTIL